MFKLESNFFFLTGPCEIIHNIMWFSIRILPNVVTKIVCTCATRSLHTVGENCFHMCSFYEQKIHSSL